MDLSPLGLTAAVLPSLIAARRCQVTAAELLTTCRVAREQNAELLALWASDERDRHRGFCIRVLLLDGDGMTLLEHTLPDETAQFPDLAPIFPAANRMQRAAFDLVGVQSDADDHRPWLWQASWPLDRYPLRRDFEPLAKWEPGQEAYAFVKVEGNGVHEIPVGPVHAGIIEPGHFRFQIVGEEVLRLEERLGYVHKGIEKRFETLSLAQGGKLAGRISGDGTVAYAWAYAQAAEAIANVTASPRAVALRALCLERERIANHLGDLGYLGNDGGFAFGLSQFSRLKENLLRTNSAAFGHRLLMDIVIPGGVACDLAPEHASALHAECAVLEREIGILRGIFDEHAGLQDRFRNCGRVSPELAAQLGLTGMAGRASDQARDLRCDIPAPPYEGLAVRKVTAPTGDVAARVDIRFDETLESLRLVRALIDGLPDGETATPLRETPPFQMGLGAVEGWRGVVLIALTSGPNGTIRRCHAHDPSWTNWPVLEHAVIGNIVPDFPLINKSFNLSYSGHDL